MKIWDNKKIRKYTCKKHETANDSCSDLVETSDFEMPVPLDKRMIKKCRVITSLSELKENRGQKLHQSKKKRENKFS